MIREISPDRTLWASEDGYYLTQTSPHGCILFGADEDGSPASSEGYCEFGEQSPMHVLASMGFEPTFTTYRIKGEQ